MQRRRAIELEIVWAGKHRNRARCPAARTASAAAERDLKRFVDIYDVHCNARVSRRRCELRVGAACHRGHRSRTHEGQHRTSSCEVCGVHRVMYPTTKVPAMPNSPACVYIEPGP
jgi:hypothetical protein